MLGGVDDPSLPSMHVSVLGALALRVDGRDRPFPPGRPGRLLAALLLADGRTVSAERLIDEVWGEEPPEDARAALHTTVTRARRALGSAAGLLVRRQPGYLLERRGVTLDSEMFRSAALAARQSGSLVSFDEALAWWRGPAWGEVAEDLAHGESLRLEELRLTLREERAAALLDAGQISESVGDLRVLVAQEPLRERPVGLLMRALHAVGDVAEALAAYEAHRTRLADELGLDPSAELAEVHRQVLSRTMESPPAQPARPSSGGSVAEPPTVRLLGRDSQVSAIGSMLAQERCVTVVGPGGVGKTSVAAAVAAAVAPTRPVWWVDLATVTDPAGVLAAVADAVGALVFPGGTVEAALRRRLETVTGLLVMDNCEHLLTASGDVIADVLACGRGVSVLSTSRERLGLSDEHVFPLPPLRLPPTDEEHLADVPAVALFVERARALVPELEVDGATLHEVAGLVRSLDGLPLAIELAAGRLGAVTIHDLRDRLVGRLDLLRSGSRRTHARHRTLSATLEWSYDPLDPEEQRVFRGLSIFAGPFDLAAAEAVLGPGTAGVVADLVDRSLVVRPGTTGRGRYRLLETLRAFARARLSASEAAALGRAHAEWAVALAGQADAGLAGPEEARWSAEVAQSLPDLDAAFRWTMATGEVAMAAGLVGSLHPWAYYHVRPELLGWSAEVLASGAPAGRVPGVYTAASAACWMAGRFEDACSHAEAGVAAAGGAGSPEAVRCLGALGDAHLALGSLEAADAAYHQASEVAEAAGIGVEAAIGACGAVLATVFARRAPDRQLERMRHLIAATENPTARAFASYAEGEAAATPAPDTALRHLARSVELARTVGNILVQGVAMSAETALIGSSGPLDRRTVDHTYRAVEHWLGSGNENLFVTCLRNVVPLLGRFSAHRAVVELVAALAASSPDRPSYGLEAERIASCLEQARASIGPEFDPAWEAGQGRTTVEAARVVLAELGELRERL